MLDVVVDRLLKRRDEILRKIESMSQGEKLGETVDWRPLSGSRSEPLAGVDGGMNLKEYKGFAVYAIDAEALVADEKGLRPLVRAADVDVIFPYWLPRERVRLYMATLEAKCALNALSRSECLVALDGSLLSIFVRPIPYTDVLARDQALARSLSDYVPLFEESAKRGETELRAREILENIAGEPNAPDIQWAALYLEYVEYLAAFRELVTSFGDRVVAVAKRSHSRELFHKMVPDSVVVEKATRGLGFVFKVMPRALKDSKWRLPVYSDELAALSFTIGYVRLDARGPVLKVELVGEASEVELRRVLEILREHSVEGYPYPLARAHMDVEITSADMETLVRSLSLYWAKTGREQLAKRRGAAIF